MDTKPSTENSDNRESEDLISAFEHLLESLPDDISTLDALVQACEQAQETDRLRKYLYQMTRAHLRQHRPEEARKLLPRLQEHAGASPEIDALIEELTPAPTPPPPPGTDDSAVHAPENNAAVRQAILQAELAFAWHLHDRKLLTRDEYSQTVQDLTDMSARSVEITISTQHALMDRGFANLDHVLAAVARESRIPILPVSRFETPMAVASIIPASWIRTRGAIPFDRVGKEYNIALLNPYNDRLQAEISAKIGQRCHFFMTAAQEFDRWLERFTANVAKASSTATDASA